MSDFFGGILDDLQGYATDVGSFFDSTLGQAVASGIKGGYNAEENNKKGNYLDVDNNVTPRVGEPIQSESFSRTEQQWLERMKTFANIDTGTSVKLGN